MILKFSYVFLKFATLLLSYDTDTQLPSSLYSKLLNVCSVRILLRLLLLTLLLNINIRVSEQCCKLSVPNFLEMFGYLGYRTLRNVSTTILLSSIRTISYRTSVRMYIIELFMQRPVFIRF